MTSTGNILVVDDEQAYRETYTDLLEREGYAVTAVGDVAAARAELDKAAWDVVILDQRLQAASGIADGLDLIGDIVVRGARVIVATGYANPEMVTRAFKDGAYDYLEKGSLLQVLLRVKVRNALEAAHELRLRGLPAPAREQRIKELWAQVQTERDVYKKGPLLEDLMALLFASIPGFVEVSKNRENAVEEIDLFIRNESTDAFWSREGAYLLAECKNWSKPVGKDELVLFRNKLESRFHRARLGFFIALGGYAKTFHVEALNNRKDASLIVPLAPKDVERLVNEPNLRSEILKEAHGRAVMVEK